MSNTLPEVTFYHADGSVEHFTNVQEIGVDCMGRVSFRWQGTRYTYRGEYVIKGEF